MRSTPRIATAAAATALLLIGVASATASADPPAERGRPQHAVELNLAGTYESGVFDSSAAEITAYDPGTRRLFVVNAASGAVDVLDAADPTRPALLFTLRTSGLPAADGSTISAAAVVNSVDVRDGVLAVAVEADPKTDPGWAAFFDTAGQARFRSAVRVGSLPDMLTFTPNGGTVLVANEAEPADDFSTDPEGSVSMVDMSAGVGALTQDRVRSATFRAWDEGRALETGVRVFGPDVAVPAGQPPAGRVARNLEPEYIAVDRTSRTAYVTLQEANAVATLDVRAGTITEIRPIPPKDYTAAGLVLDASDRDGGVNLRNQPVTGLAMPDAISTYESRGRTLLVTANEGDAREWGDYVEPLRIGSSAYRLCPDVFPDAAVLKRPENLGRLNATRAGGLRADGCYAQIQVFGGRSFSILDTDGTLLFDSGARIEQKIAELIGSGELPMIAFNATHTTNPSFDTRSDDKGPEPEGVAVGRVEGRTYAFVGLERIGGVMVFDITDPGAVGYVDYVNNRNWDAVYDGQAVPGAGDLGTEGVEFIAAQDSPTGRPLLAVANEVSGSTSLFTIDPVRPGPRG